jgi:predicted ribosome quality control (RQC) complex YloA/Tae2 family protein
MPLDAVFLTALTLEISMRLTGAKIDKIQMPERDTLLLTVRSAGENLRLLLSAGTGARVHFTESDFENPAAPPMFCMLLRKHLAGARIARVEQPFMERMLTLELTVPDEMGDIVKKRLVIELIGRAGNVILVGADGRIVGCLRQVDAEKNEMATAAARSSIPHAAETG